MGKSAPGPDGISPRVMNKRKTERTTAFLNLILTLETIPDHLNLARVLFIPKSETPQGSGDYRPISITSVVVRCLHSILAKRWITVVPRLHSQLAFLKRDGCFEGVVSVHTILREARLATHNLTMCSIDISKAFDSLSHDTIKRMAEAYGAPKALVSYISNCYKSLKAIVHNNIVKVGRGVRQGDPLSPLLFIMCMDEVTRLTTREHGTKLGSQMVDSVLFADDMMIFADTTVGMQHKLDMLSAGLQQAGLSTNVQKSRSLTVAANGKLKTVCVVPHTYKIGGVSLDPINVTDKFKYLGIWFSHPGITKQPISTMADSLLNEITNAPLTPVQRLTILRQYALPKLQYVCQVGAIGKTDLQKVDVSIRKSVRQWLGLPHDTANTYFHARDGGIGIEPLYPLAEIRRSQRLRRLNTRNCSLLQAVRQSEAYKLFEGKSIG
ncbi:unnamed protein product, partial [Schistosoma mattheei]